MDQKTIKNIRTIYPIRGMFDSLRSEQGLMTKLQQLIDEKKKLIYQPQQLKKVVNEQELLLRFLDEKSEKVDARILNEALQHFSNPAEARLLEALASLNSSQENILFDSLRQEIEQIKEQLGNIKNIHAIELNIMSRNNFKDLEVQLKREEHLLDELKQVLEKADGLRSKLDQHIELAKELEHKDWFRSIVIGISKLVINGRYTVVVSGLENIPNSGPVMIAPRHYHGTYDPLIFNSIIQRRIFFLSAKDWVKDGVQVQVLESVFKKYGAVPINRPDSIFQKETTQLHSAYKSIVRLLMLNQAMVIFPEGYGYVNSNWKDKARAAPGFLEIKLGVFHFVDYVQKKKKVQIPIIPVGVHYDNFKKWKSIIRIKIGKAMFIPLSNRRIDFEPYKCKLQSEIEHLSAA
jgi:1-acyl-sn-glycerol-3-phosphate acyltransferase